MSKIDTTTPRHAVQLLGEPEPGIIALHGEAGSGKSMILFAYTYYLLQEVKRPVFWLDLEGSIFGTKLVGQPGFFYMDATGYDADQILASIHNIPANATVIFDGMGQMAVFESLMAGRQVGTRGEIQAELIKRIRLLDGVPRQIIMTWTTRRTGGGAISGVSSGVRFAADNVVELR